MTDLVERKLGVATAKLQQRVLDIIEKTGAGRARDALLRINLSVLCGSYHDFKSGQVLPKADLAADLRKIVALPPASWMIAELVADIAAGIFADTRTESRRWMADAGDRSASRPDDAPHAIDLKPAEYRVFVWIYRYVEVYGQSPTQREVADGVGMHRLEVDAVQRKLEKKGALVHIGGVRGWLPIRAP